MNVALSTRRIAPCLHDASLSPKLEQNSAGQVDGAILIGRTEALLWTGRHRTGVPARWMNALCQPTTGCFAMWAHA
jgi:hypothetical protein